jgi:hypothetical protein
MGINKRDGIMKRFSACSVLLVLMAVLSGCEGHVRTLHLKESKDIKAPSSFSSKTILIKSNKNVYAEIENISKELSLHKNPSKKNMYYSDDFFMYVNKKGKGLWEVGLKDWPETSRSETSKKVEKLIRKRLEKK